MEKQTFETLKNILTRHYGNLPTELTTDLNLYIQMDCYELLNSSVYDEGKGTTLKMEIYDTMYNLYYTRVYKLCYKIEKLTIR